jgi:cyclic dehypoxanthinyl futalosine synthase
VTQGRDIGQLALLFGANDMGSLMIEENVVSAAGTVHHLTLEQMRSAISELGFVPRRRNVFYELFEDDEPVSPADPPRDKARAVHLPVAATTP